MENEQKNEKSIERCINTLKKTLQLYTEHHIRNRKVIIEEMRKYLHQYLPATDIKITKEIIDNEPLIDLEDDFYIIPVDVLFIFWDENGYISTDKLIGVIEWYLDKYYPECTVIKRA